LCDGVSSRDNIYCYHCEELEERRNSRIRKIGSLLLIQQLLAFLPAPVLGFLAHLQILFLEEDTEASENLPRELEDSSTASSQEKAWITLARI
jgi:hypothetical protein